MLHFQRLFRDSPHLSRVGTRQERTAETTVKTRFRFFGVRARTCDHLDELVHPLDELVHHFDHLDERAQLALARA